MRRLLGSVCSVAIAVSGFAALGGVAPAYAQTSGPVTGKGFLVAHYDDAGNRYTLASQIHLKGAVNDVGRIVERDNLPGDPDIVNRDDLVFADGTLSIVNTALYVAIDVNPKSCQLAITVTETSTVYAGTGAFADAAGTLDGAVHGHALAARAPDRSCSMELPLRFEIDRITLEGTMTL